MNSYWGNQKGNQKNSRNKLQWKHNNSQPMGYSKSSYEKKVYSNTILPQETRKTSKRHLNFTHKTTGKRTTTIKKKPGRNRN